MKADLVVTFDSANHAIAAEYFCKSNGIKMELIPSPREITYNCGFSLLIYQQDVVEIYEIFNKNDVLFAKIFLKQNHNGEIYYEEKDN